MALGTHCIIPIRYLMMKSQLAAAEFEKPPGVFVVSRLRDQIKCSRQNLSEPMIQLLGIPSAVEFQIPRLANLAKPSLTSVSICFNDGSSVLKRSPSSYRLYQHCSHHLSCHTYIQSIWEYCNQADC